MSERFRRLKEHAEAHWRDMTAGDIPLIRIGTAMCATAAGAFEVKEALVRDLARLGLEARVREVGCLGLCYAEPLVDILTPGGPRIFYSSMAPDMVPRVLSTQLLQGIVDPELALAYLGDPVLDHIPCLSELPMMRGQLRLALCNAGHIDPADVEQYIAQGGYAALDGALSSMTPEQVIDIVRDSGLRGRGGAAFPTGLKWSFLGKAPGPTKYILVNSEEGDPGAFNDKSILESNTHQLIEGTILAGFATGADKGYVFIRQGHEGPIRQVTEAIRQAREKGLLGEHILGSDFSFDINVTLTGDSYVAGEETALMEAIEGRRAMPRFRPPFPAAEGLWRYPSDVNNVKTLAYVPHIVMNGPKWFSDIGDGQSTGTAVLCLSGDLTHTGIVEVPMGVSLRWVLEGLGGGSSTGKGLKIIQVGGPLGGFLSMAQADICVDFESMSAAGASLGSGGIVVADVDACAVDLTRLLVAFCQFESCGKCFPCRLGTAHLLEIMERIERTQTRSGDLELLRTVGQSMAGGSLCGHGQLGFNPIQSALRYFPEDFRAHVDDGRCLTGACDRPIVAPQRTRPSGFQGG